MGRPPLAAFRSQEGFTIIEAMVACVVLLVGVMAVAGLIDSSNDSTVRTRTRVISTNVAREVVEAARGVSYSDISDSTILQQIQASEPGLADEQPGGPFTVKRRGVVFTITADTCIMDDARDGGGPSPRAGDFCADSVAPNAKDLRGFSDRFPEDYKRVKVNVQWTQKGEQKESIQTTFVNNPGSAGAPAVLTLTAPGLGEPPRHVLPGETQVVFAATTSSQPYTLRWLLDGAVHETVCVGCTGKGPFPFRWELQSNTGDGPYLIIGEATDSFGVAGQSRSMTVFVNRSRPIAPQGFAGGHQANRTVQLEWLPNPERDLRGYAVYRTDASGTSLVCPLQTGTSCVDPDPPADDAITYRVHAYDTDYDGTTPRQSPNSSETRVLRDNRPPHPPTDATIAQDGPDTILRWQVPDPQDPDTGDEIVFYRIYRDGTAVGNQYARGIHDANGAGSFVDRTGGESHTYFIAAVDTQLRESVLVGPLR